MTNSNDNDPLFGEDPFNEEDYEVQDLRPLHCESCGRPRPLHSFGCPLSERPITIPRQRRPE